MERILCVGGAHLDIYATPYTSLVGASSVPGAVALRSGGVARNIAVALARFGHESVLLSALGVDVTGGWIRRDLAASGVEFVNLTAERSVTTGAYVSLSDGAQLAHAVADTRALDSVRPRDLTTALDSVGPAALVIACCNLAVPLLQTLLDWCARRGVRLWIEPVSVTKSLRIAALHGGIDLISPNVLEACALLAKLRSDSGRPRGPSIRRWLVTRGAAGLAYYDRHDSREATRLFDAVPTHAVNVHGAGDVALAAFAAAHLAGRSIAESCAAAVRAAAAAVGGTEPVPPALTLECSPLARAGG